MPNEIHRSADLLSATHRIQHLIPSLERYVNMRCPTGGFLYAVLSNDLEQACARADGQNRYLLYDIMFYLFNEPTIPAECWGSPKRVKAWVERPAKTVDDV